MDEVYEMKFIFNNKGGIIIGNMNSLDSRQCTWYLQIDNSSRVE